MGNARIHVNRVTASNIVRELKGVLHDVYIRELQWQPWTEPNYSNIMVLADERGFYLEDDFSDCCDWFEITVDSQRAGVFRAIPFAQMEIRRYLPEAKLGRLPATPFEFNRCALRAEFRSIPGLMQALRDASIAHAAATGCSSVIATAHPNIKQSFVRSGYQVIDRFRYYPQDRNQVDLLYRGPQAS